MAEIPQLVEEDFQQFNALLNDLLSKSEAGTALIVEKAGYLIHQCGDHDWFDTTTLATLASNAYNATEFMANQCLQEPSFSAMFQQGEKFSTLILKVDVNFLLVVIFKAQLSVGAVKYYAAATAKQLAAQLQKAAKRTPGVAFDLVDMNTTDVGAVFRKKEQEKEKEKD